MAHHPEARTKDRGNRNTNAQTHNGINWEDHVRNEDIRSKAKVKPVSRHMRKRRLQWYGHVQRRDSEEDIRYVTELKIVRKRKRGRPK